VMRGIEEVPSGPVGVCRGQDNGGGEGRFLEEVETRLVPREFGKTGDIWGPHWLGAVFSDTSGGEASGLESRRNRCSFKGKGDPWGFGPALV
jgi:hypothetical protein